MAAPFWRLISPMAMAHAARSLSSLTICSSNASIRVRHSAMSIVFPHSDDTCWSTRSCVHLARDLVCILGLGAGAVFAKRADEVANGCGRLLGRGALDKRDDGAADDGGIGEGGDRAHVFSIGDAEAERDGELRELFE